MRSLPAPMFIPKFVMPPGAPAEGVARSQQRPLKQRFAPLNRAILADGRAIGSSIPLISSSSTTRIRVRFAELAGRTANLSLRVTRLKVPKRFQAVRLRLANGLFLTARDLLRVAKAARDRQPARMQRARRAFAWHARIVKQSRGRFAARLGL